jgi:hypothetical protein
VADCCECGDEPSGSCTTELVSCIITRPTQEHYRLHDKPLDSTFWKSPQVKQYNTDVWIVEVTEESDLFRLLQNYRKPRLQLCIQYGSSDHYHSKCSTVECVAVFIKFLKLSFGKKLSVFGQLTFCLSRFMSWMKAGFSASSPVSLCLANDATNWNLCVWPVLAGGEIVPAINGWTSDVLTTHTLILFLKDPS